MAGRFSPFPKFAAPARSARFPAGVRVALALGLAAALSGCTSVADFLEMTPEHRAAVTCARAEPLRRLEARVGEIRAALGTAEANVERGYAVHRSCRDVPDGTDTHCRRDRYGDLHCRSFDRTRLVRRCSDTPVAIDVRAEGEKARRLRGELAAAEAELRRARSDCEARAMNLTAEEAFYLWENGIMP